MNEQTDRDLARRAMMDEATRARILRLAIDYGTSTISISYQFVTRDGRERSPIEDIAFNNGSHSHTSDCLWYNGKLIWGEELTAGLQNNLFRYTDCIKHAKLSLYESPETYNVSRRVDAKLRTFNKDMSDLLTESIIAWVGVAKEKISGSFYQLAYNVNDIEIELYLSVPQMWKPSACRAMTSAAQRAGFRCELVYEPLCAAAHTMQMQIESKIPILTEPMLEVGDIVMIADIGCGTGDFVSYRIMSSPHDGQKIKLEVAKQPEGKLCGGINVNNNFLAWLRDECLEVKKFGGVESAAAFLGMEPEDFMEMASSEFERLKPEFPQRNMPYWLGLSGRDSRTENNIMIPMNRERMATFFDPAVENICQAVKEELLPETKLICVPGGFGRNTYLTDTLKNRFGNNNTTSVVEHTWNLLNSIPHGALARYTSITVRGLGSPACFAIGRQETWDPLVHVDATTTLNGQRVPDVDVVEQSAFEKNILLVHDRAHVMVEKGADVYSRTQWTSDQAWTIHYQGINESLVISQPIYWSERDLKDHEPLKTPDGNLRSGIHVYAKPEISIEDGSNWNFKVVTNSDGIDWYEFWIRSIIYVDGANVKFGWQVAPYDDVPYDEQGNPRTMRNPGPVIWKDGSNSMKLFEWKNDPIVADEGQMDLD